MKSISKILTVVFTLAPLALGAEVPVSTMETTSRDPAACRGGTAADRCNVDLAPWEQGCSCSEACGFAGNCCVDIDTCDRYDPSSGQKVKDFGDGRQYLQSVLPKTAYAGSYQRQQTTYSFPREGSAAWLSTVRFGDLDNGQPEKSVCRVDSAVPLGGTSALWYVHADKTVDWGNNDAKCGITGMTFPSTGSSSELPQVLDVVTVATDGVPVLDLGLAVDSAGRLNSAVVMTSMEAYEIDRGSVGCRAYMAPSPEDGQFHWYVQAEHRPVAEAPAEVACGFRKIVFPDAAAVRIRDAEGGDYRAWDHGATHDDFERTLQEMTRDSTSACFFTEVTIARTMDEELPGCEIKRAESRTSPPLYTDAWMLKAHAKEGAANFAECSAMCIELLDSPSERRPRTPTYVAVGDAPAPSEFLTLHQAGAYDRPLLLVMGFNPDNTLGSTLMERKLAPLMKVLQAPPLEYDIWFYNVNGAKDVMAAARDVARAIVAVTTFDGGFNGKAVVIGFSQGGLTARIALSKWETGAYQATGAEPVAGVTSLSPPVSLLATVGAPNLGAAGPTSILGALTEMNRSFASQLGDLSQSPIFGMINSQPARQMLEKRLDCYQPWITQECGLGRADTLRDGAWERWGTTPGETRTLPWTGGCVYQTLPEFSELYGAANSLGRRGNGFPDTVPVIAVVNAGWTPQGCEALAPENPWCRNAWPSFSTDTTLGEMHFRDTGHSSLGFCDTDSHLYLKMNAIDLRPGDLSDVQFEWLINDIVNTPRQVDRVEVKQNSPFLRTHTGSALYCPHSTTEQECRDQNRRNRRFVDVLSRYGTLWDPNAGSAGPALDNRNGMHSSLHDDLVRKLLAYVHEYSLGDGDGRIDQGNPFGCQVEPDGRTVCFCHKTREVRANNFDDDCDREVDEVSVSLSGPESIVAKATYTYTALPENFLRPTYTWSERFCEDAAGTTCTTWATITGLGEAFERTLGPDCRGTGEKTFRLRVTARDIDGRQAVAELTTELCRRVDAW